jgi:hypothetical protein
MEIKVIEVEFFKGIVENQKHASATGKKHIPVYHRTKYKNAKPA